jgi:enoyl-CoA hydratase/carnithine racemase
MMLETIDHGAIRELKLARPPVNALNPELVEMLTEALKDAAESADAIVVSGREGMFSAGLDVPTLLELDRNGMSRFWQAFFRLLEAIASSPVPVAFAITGHSPAGGAVLALFGDYRVMSRGEFKIGLNEVRVGLVVPTVIQRALVRLTGAHKAERLMVAGELIGPEQAFGLGMIDALEDNPEAVVNAAIAWCEKHLALPRSAMLETRRAARSELVALFDDFSELGIEIFVTRWFSEETQNTLRALVAQLKKK